MYQPQDRLLILMAKRPIYGFVKTRLASQLGKMASLQLYRQMLEEMMQTALDPRWRTLIAWTPDIGKTGGLRSSRMAHHCVTEIGQGLGDLGLRQMNLLHLAAPSQKKIVIGSDCPSLCKADIWHAFGRVGPGRSVIGPAKDGGYYLLGLQGFVPRSLFDRVPWSCSDTEAVLRQNLSRLGYQVTPLRELQDIDEMADLAALERVTQKWYPVLGA